jgi:hypothetical protein
MFRLSLLKLAAATALAMGGAAYAQQTQEQPPAASEWVAADPGDQDVEEAAPPSDASNRASAAAAGSSKVARKDVFSAAEGVFGKGAEGLADLIEDLLRKQGEPSAYITGREAGGAFVVGLRYGSGTLHHQVEGDRAIYWTGPSLGFDFGADAAKVFVLVYNVHDSQRIFKRFPAAEGNAIVVGGFTASYMRRGDMVLIPSEWASARGSASTPATCAFRKRTAGCRSDLADQPPKPIDRVRLRRRLVAADARHTWEAHREA